MTLAELCTLGGSECVLVDVDDGSRKRDAYPVTDTEAIQNIQKALTARILKRRKRDADPYYYEDAWIENFPPASGRKREIEERKREIEERKREIEERKRFAVGMNGDEDLKEALRKREIGYGTTIDARKRREPMVSIIKQMRKTLDMDNLITDYSVLEPKAMLSHHREGVFGKKTHPDQVVSKYENQAENQADWKRKRAIENKEEMKNWELLVDLTEFNNKREEERKREIEERKRDAPVWSLSSTLNGKSDILFFGEGSTEAAQGRVQYQSARKRFKVPAWKRVLEFCPDFDEKNTLNDGYTKAIAHPSPGFNCINTHFN